MLPLLPPKVLEQKVDHIDSVPSFPEPYYTPTGKEVQPKPVGEECGIVVYQYYPISAVNYVSLPSFVNDVILWSGRAKPKDKV